MRNSTLYSKFSSAQRHAHQACRALFVDPLESRQLLSVASLSFVAPGTGQSDTVVSVSSNNRNDNTHNRHKKAPHRNKGAAAIAIAPADIVATFTGSLFVRRSVGIGSPSTIGAELVVTDASVGGNFTGNFTLDRVGTSDVSGIITGDRLSFALTGPATAGTFTGSVSHHGSVISGTLFANSGETFVQGTLALTRTSVSDGSVNRTGKVIVSNSGNVSESRAKKRAGGGSSVVVDNTAHGRVVVIRSPVRNVVSITDPIIGSVAIGNLGGRAFAGDFLGTGLGVTFNPIDTGFGTRRITTTDFAFEPVTAGAFASVTAGAFAAF